MSKKTKQPLVRIAQEIKVAATRGWSTTGFYVQVRDDVSSRIEVHSPDDARTLAGRLAAAIGGRVYRGTLPTDWQQALADIPRS